jgi:hypothetical protein
MTSTPEMNYTWHDTSRILRQIEDSDHPTLLFSNLRIMGVPLDGTETTWKGICDDHKKEVVEAVQKWSSLGGIPTCSEEAMLLLRVRAATARSFLLGLMGIHATLPGGLFPFPKGSPDAVARILLTDWWDSAGYGFAGRSFQLWAKGGSQ